MPRILVHRLRDEFDWVLFSLVTVIALSGVVNLYSTGLASDAPDLYLTQIYWLVFGACCAFAVAIIDYRHYERHGYILFGCGIFLLLLVLMVGTEINHSTRWFSLGEYRFQPSELMKVALVIGLAKYLHHDPRVEGRKLQDLFIPALMTALAMVLILKEPDLGTALLCLLIFLSIMMLTRLTARSTITLVLSTPIVAILGWNYLLKDYQKERIVSFWNLFVDPEADKLGAGWHANQSMIAIGSGKITGKGYLQGTAGPHQFLPECRTDFPFSVPGDVVHSHRRAFPGSIWIGDRHRSGIDLLLAGDHQPGDGHGSNAGGGSDATPVFLRRIVNPHLHAVHRIADERVHSQNQEIALTASQAPAMAAPMSDTRSALPTATISFAQPSNAFRTVGSGL